MSATFTTNRRVEFRDTDAAGIVHFSVFFNYMEQAEHEFLRHLGLSVIMPHEDGSVGWPRVSATCDYRSTAHFEETLDITVRVEAIGGKSITYGFEFTRDGQPIATGKFVVVCCVVQPGRPPKSIAVPDHIRQLLEK